MKKSIAVLFFLVSAVPVLFSQNFKEFLSEFPDIKVPFSLTQETVDKAFAEQKFISKVNGSEYLLEGIEQYDEVYSIEQIAKPIGKFAIAGNKTGLLVAYKVDFKIGIKYYAAMLYVYDANGEYIDEEELYCYDARLNNQVISRNITIAADFKMTGEEVENNAGKTVKKTVRFYITAEGKIEDLQY